MSKIKDFFKSLSRAGRIVLGIWLLCLIALIAFFVIRNNKDDDSDKDNSPEVAQIYEPSIGSPLPADTPGGAVTTEPSNSADEKNGTVAGDSTTTPSTEMVAPATGIDPSKPVAYENSSLKFAATLPAGTQVEEQNNTQGSRIIFTSKQGSLLFIVSTSTANSESLQTIESQLRNSPSASNITATKFGGKSALQFTSKEYGNGVVFIANGKIYYLLGNSKYFPTFKNI